MPKSVIACRPHSYAPFLDRAYPHLVGLGVRHVEITIPGADELTAARADLDRYGLSVSSVQGICDVQRADVAAQIAAQMPACAALGARLLFLSVKAEGTPLPTVYERLRSAGETAARHGVTLILETHPDLVTNSAVALATMRGVDHPNVRINFDTANIYFYNQGVDAVDELRRVLPYVAALHLKDTNGGYRAWHFPALGRGVVRFAEIFELLDGAGFMGPCTLEIEGIEGERRTAELVCERIAESVAFLRQLGRL